MMRCALVTAEVCTVAPVGEHETAFLISDDGKTFLFKIGKFEKEFYINQFFDALRRLDG